MLYAINGRKRLLQWPSFKSKAHSSSVVDNINIFQTFKKQVEKAVQFQGEQVKIFRNAHKIAGHYRVIDVPSSQFLFIYFLMSAAFSDLFPIQKIQQCGISNSPKIKLQAIRKMPQNYS